VPCLRAFTNSGRNITICAWSIRALEMLRCRLGD
jgi:hypothetical protein